MMTDSQLLQAWAKDRDHNSFAELVRRHQDMVYSCCLRKLSRTDLAQDAAQQTFASLAAKAGKLVNHSNLGGWLYKAALLESSSMLKMETRRQIRHEKYSQQESIPSSSIEENAAELNDLLRHLDDALMDLKESDRDVLVRRFFQNQPLRGIGEALGTTEEAARKRVTRAIDTLAGIFRRRGVTACSVGLLSAALAKASHAAPATLLPAATATAKSTALTAQAVSSLSLTKTQIAMACALAATVPIGIQWKQNYDLKQQNAEMATRLEQLSTVAQPSPAAPKPEAPVANAASQNRTAKADPAAKAEKRGRWPRPHPHTQQRAAVQAARLEMFKERLQLTTDQESGILAIFQNANESQKNLWERFSSGERNFEAFQNALLADGIAAEEIKTLLTPEQLVEYEQIRLEDRADKAELEAGKDLAELQPVLLMTSEQKDAVFAVLSQIAYEWDREFMPPAKDEAEFNQRRADKAAQKRERLARILTESQLARYDEATKYSWGPPPPKEESKSSNERPSSP